jgi:hypothetical protein
VYLYRDPINPVDNPNPVSYSRRTRDNIYLMIALRGRNMSLNLHETMDSAAIRPIICTAALKTVSWECVCIKNTILSEMYFQLFYFHKHTFEIVFRS